MNADGMSVFPGNAAAVSADDNVATTLGPLLHLAAQLAGAPIAYAVLHGSTRPVAPQGIDPARLPALAASVLLSDLARDPAPSRDMDLPTIPRYRADAVADWLGRQITLTITGETGPLGVLCLAGVSSAPADWGALEAVARAAAVQIGTARRLSDLQQSESALRVAHDQLDLDYRGLLDNMADGVLSIGPDRQIEVLNPVGSTILGYAADDVVGRTLLEAFMEREDNDAFIDAVLLPLVEQADNTRSIVTYRRGTETLQLSVASATYRLRHGPQQGRLGVITAFSDVTEVASLRAAEEALKQQLQDEHAKLQSAYVTLEQSAKRERAVTRRSQMIGLGAVAGIFVAITAVGLYTWLPANALFAAQSDTANTGSSGTITITPQPVSSRIAVVGTIDAGSVVNIVGPYDGLVKQIFFRYGGAVERGKPLLQLETADLDVALRDAEGAEIRANQKVTELRGWADGPDMSRARRTVTSNELDLSALRSRAAQTKMLLSKGIVAADEYTQIQQQLRGLELQLQAARQDLAATESRGSEENRRVADFELANAHAKVVGLRNDLSHAQLVAPVSGVVLQPPDTDSSKRTEMVAAGSRVNRGQTMFAIGNLETMSVRAKVDEIDINKVRVGQAVSISGDALEGTTLTGKVTAVAAQASGDSTVRTGMAAFPVTVEIAQLTPEQRAVIHVGMTANLSIIAYDKPDAIVIPFAALHTTDAGRSVMVRRDGKTDDVPVTLGISTPAGVEIRSGLKPGDIVEMP